MELLGDVGHVESHSVRSEMVIVLVQDRSMVCTKRTIGSKFVWTHPMLILGDEDQVEARFGSFGDCANLDARSVHCLH